MIAADLLASGARRLRPVAGEGARREARLLLAGALEAAPEMLLTSPETPVEPIAAARFESMIARRLRHEPVSRILGRREFWSLPFEITPDVLDPRPDSETLVEAVLDALAERARPWRLLDLGTGSGCLLLALLSELPQARGVGADKSIAALDVARRNAARLGLATRARFVETDWCHGVEGRFDIVVSNPPYIRSGERSALMPEVALFDPVDALFAGAEGLDAYGRIATGLSTVLAGDALIALEIGAGMAAAVSAIMVSQGFRPSGRRSDLAGRERVLLFRQGQK